MILRLLCERGAGKTICPSEAARAWSPQDWRMHMDTVRHVCFELADEGVVVITQRGRVVDGRAARGLIRVALAQPRESVTAQSGAA
ncbi:MAG: DUF3253 domain-containing protein [Anaerolineae bacterium]|nr:DUF3253 domain-containing protein [Thermoflexales bacterium]MDW8396531.1 DUF3253 domain-containing protein [Anaerolineae bacterium]